MRKFFELNRPYQFDITDITAFIYVICTYIGITGGNPTPLFLLGSAISTALLNGSLFLLNLVSFIRMF